MSDKRNSPKQKFDIISAQKELMDARQKIENALALLDTFLIGSYRQGISIDMVAEVVCSVVGVAKEEFVSPSRKREIVNARHIYSHLSVNYLNHDIADSMSLINRDRSVYYNNKEKHDAYYGVEDEYTALYDKSLKKIKELENEKAN